MACSFYKICWLMAQKNLAGSGQRSQSGSQYRGASLVPSTGRHRLACLLKLSTSAEFTASGDRLQKYYNSYALLCTGTGRLAAQVPGEAERAVGQGNAVSVTRLHSTELIAFGCSPLWEDS